MDTEQGESFAQLLGQRRSTIEERAAQLDGVIQGIDSFWRGADAENFRSEWSRTHGTLISQAVERLWALARELSDHAQEQDICSAEGAGKIGERLSDLFPFGGPLENPLAGFADAIGPWLRNAHGLRSASQYLGPAGHVLTGGLAFADRWTEDAGDPSLSTGERVVRGAVDGGANVAGAAAGAWAGAKGGAAAGAVIGSIFPGPGTAIGGVVGGVIGGIAGGITGGGLADAAIDWILG